MLSFSTITQLVKTFRWFTCYIEPMYPSKEVASLIYGWFRYFLSIVCPICRKKNSVNWSIIDGVVAQRSIINVKTFRRFACLQCGTYQNKSKKKKLRHWFTAILALSVGWRWDYTFYLKRGENFQYVEKKNHVDWTIFDGFMDQRSFINIGGASVA